MKTKIPLTILICWVGFGVWFPTVSAQEVKERMKARLPVIRELKQAGVIGENNKGFLEFRTGERRNADVVNVENQDRRLVYEAIAKSQGTTVDLVGRRRAIQIREIAEPGDWLQDENGNWYRK